MIKLWNSTWNWAPLSGDDGRQTKQDNKIEKIKKIKQQKIVGLDDTLRLDEIHFIFAVMLLKHSTFLIISFVFARYKWKK